MDELETPPNENGAALDEGEVPNEKDVAAAAGFGAAVLLPNPNEAGAAGDVLAPPAPPNANVG